MKTKENFYLTRWQLIGVVSIAALLSWSSVTGQRGQGVSVRIKVENGVEIDLYDESHALVIGVSDYTAGWRDLDSVKDDLEQVSALLKGHGFKVEPLPNPTRAQLDAALRRFISNYGLRERNRLLIYFAGHGHTEELPDGRDLGYIVPADAPLPERDPQLFNERAISMDEMEAFALRIRSKHALFVFDSCFSGSIFETRSERRPPPEIESKTASPVRQFITSGTKQQEVPADSIFRRYFVRAFEQREGDLNSDGFITGEELGIYLAGRVASDSRDTQTPRYGKIRNVRLNLGDFVFALPKRPAPTPAPTPAYLAEQSLWETVRESSDPGELEAYRKKYCPGGVYCDAAEIRLRRLRETSASTTTNPAPSRPNLPTPVITLLRGVDPSRLAIHTFTTASVDAKGNVSKFAGAPTQQYAEDLGSGVRLEMVAVRGGAFTMGSENGHGDVKPPHQVTVGDFWIGKFEVTQAQWRAVMGTNPSNFKGDDLPVESVSWEEAKEFCFRLNAKLGLTDADGYRLPSEAEWEYAARAGSKTEFAFGETISTEIVNYDGKFPYGGAPKGANRKKTVAVGSLGVANAWGLFDLHGNVFEWCEDDDHYSYDGAPADGRAWVNIPLRASSRINRGGSWGDGAAHCRSANRSYASLIARGRDLGFRLSRTASGK